MYASIYISKTHILLVCIFDNFSGNEKIEPWCYECIKECQSTHLGGSLQSFTSSGFEFNINIFFFHFNLLVIVISGLSWNFCVSNMVVCHNSHIYTSIYHKLIYVDLKHISTSPTTHSAGQYEIIFLQVLGCDSNS